MRADPIPRLYAILDGGAVRASGHGLLGAAQSLREAGIALIQYRDKQASSTKLYENACAIKTIFRGSGATLILNDWPEVALAAGWDGVHVGQSDAAVAEARKVLGTERLVGVSTHSPEQFHKALETDADYLAYGPIFSTTTKEDAEAPVGLEGLRLVRSLSSRPLVAIGGISRDRMTRVFDAGADCVALIGALYRQGHPVLNTASELLRASDPSAEH